MESHHVMISYQWEAQERMLKLKDELTRAGYTVWMDLEKMEGNLSDRMSEAVEKSSAILICFSERYQASTSCKKEAQYADHLKKHIIPLKYEAFQPSGWLGFMINVLLYYNVQTDETMMENLPRIIKALESAGHENLHTVSTTASADRPRGTGQFTVDVLQKELTTFYEHEMGTVQLLPWGNDVVGMDAIFVNSTLTVDEKLPFRSAGKVLTGPSELLALKSMNGQKVKRVLVKGIAGSGKSTALAKLAYDWAKYVHSNDAKYSILSQYKLLFMLSLREIEKAESFTDAIFDQILPQDTGITKPEVEAYLQSHGSDILILLDGLDEFPMEQLQKKVTGDIESLLANRKLRDACVVVTTRPHNVEYLGEHQKHYAQVKLTGFSENNIELYIKKFFEGNQKAAKGLIGVLQQSPSIKTLAEIPVMLLMLCLLWSDAQKLPETSTALYEQVILYLWKRYRNSCYVKDEEILKVLLTVGKVALDGITSGGNLVFSEKDFPDQILKEACKAGLLTKERLRSKLNISNSVSFLHKSVQEYCAAYYWVSLADKGDDSFKSYLKYIADDGQVFVQVEMLTFCCGMSEKAAAFILPHVVEVFKHRTEDSLRIGGITQTAQKDIWPLFLMLRESKLEYKAVHAWFEPLFRSNVVEIRQNPPSSLAYFHHLVRIVSKSRIPSCLSEVHELKLFCGSGSFGLIVETLDEMTHVESLVLSWETEVIKTRPTENQIAALSDKISRLPKLKDITVLARDKLDVSRIIVSLLRGSSVLIRKIELGNVEFDTEIMGNALKRQTSLKSLILTNVTLTSQGAAQMLSQIRSSIQRIQIEGSKVGEAVYNLKPFMPSLEEVILTNTKLQEDHVAFLADLVPKAGRLKHLDLSWNNVGSSMVKLARKLQHCSLLHTLTLLNTNLTQNGVIALTASFPYMPRLVNIMLSLGEPDGTGFEILETVFRSLHHIPKLEIMVIKRLSTLEDSSPGDLICTCFSAINFNHSVVTKHSKIGSKSLCVFNMLFNQTKLQKLKSAITLYEEQMTMNAH